MGSFEPDQKRPRTYENVLTVDNGNYAAMEAPPGAEYFTFQAIDYREFGLPTPSFGSKSTKPCIKFFSTSGCPYGEGCHFLHFVPGGINVYGLAPISSATGFKKNGFTYAGQSDAADPRHMVHGTYKTRLCNSFNSAEGCRFGERCHFAHGEHELRSQAKAPNGPSQDVMTGQMATSSYANGLTTYPMDPLATSLYYGEPTPPGVTAIPLMITPTTTSKISIESSLAGAVIGRAGANVRQISRLTGAKLSVRDHETNPHMRNIELEGLPEQIERASEMVRQFLQTREMVVVPAVAPTLGSHNFKTKLCENFAQGTCTFADNCHFAHGANELRCL